MERTLQLYTVLILDFGWDRDSLGPAEPVLGPWPLIESKIVETAVSKMKICVVAGVSGVVAEMMTTSG